MSNLKLFKLSHSYIYVSSLYVFFLLNTG